MNNNISPSRPALIGLALLGLCRASATVQGAPRQRTADEVLLVCNSNSPTSIAIGDDYVEKRHVKNRLFISCPDSAISAHNETIPFQSFTNLIEQPVREYLSQHQGIDFIVLTKGVPIRVSGAAFGSCDEHSKAPLEIRGHPSVDSSIAALDYNEQAPALKIDIAGSGAVGYAYSNRYWNVSEPFSHAKFGGYLVTRLDGYTEKQAEDLTSQSLQADVSRPTGKYLLDTQPIFGLGDKSTQPVPISGVVIPRESEWSGYNADLQHAHDLLTERNIPNELDLSETFVGNRTNLAGYFSWGSNDARYTTNAYQTLFFTPGSFSDTAVSTCARTFLPTHGGQSLLEDLIAHGLTCGKGYVDEPLLQANASPTIALDHYTSGYTMAESFYSASHFVNWEDIIVGDPLCCPYPRR